METTVEILNKIANKLGDENADQYTTATVLSQVVASDKIKKRHQ